MKKPFPFVKTDEKTDPKSKKVSAKPVDKDAMVKTTTKKTVKGK